ASVVQQPGTALWVQPVTGLQASVVHTLPSSHTSAVPARHWWVDGSQRSTPVHALPSSHAASVVQQPGTTPCVHPVPGLQASVVHTLPSSHASAVPARHWWVDGSQRSTPGQTVPSSHAASVAQQFGTTPYVHPGTGLQASVVHTLPSSHASAVPARHWWVDGSQRSTPVQTLPSSHAASVAQQFGTTPCVHPVTGLQASVVHTLPSSHVSAVPARHWWVNGSQR